jgi:predicted phosphodiesterase
VLDKFNVNFLLYGHTHIPYQMEKPESQEWIVCPGSPERPRDNQGPCYAMIKLDKKNVIINIKSINNVLK